VVGNAERHGEAPVEMRLWAEGDNIVAKVSDAGPGPEDPCVGLMPREGDPFAGGGRGLWIAHQLCTDVSLSYQEGSFSVRMLLSPSR
jgi:anti-sigma regulatory factor (Ser/Thr protein kinase)